MYALHMSVGSFPDISESDSECLALVFWKFLIKKLVKCSVNTASQLVTVSIHCALLGLITVWINDFLSPCSTVGVMTLPKLSYECLRPDGSPRGLWFNARLKV